MRTVLVETGGKDYGQGVKWVKTTLCAQIMKLCYIHILSYFLGPVLSISLSLYASCALCANFGFKSRLLSKLYFNTKQHYFWLLMVSML